MAAGCARTRSRGLTRGTTRAHLVRAALEAIAHQVADVVDAFPEPPTTLRADGGATANGFLMQFQADLLGVPVEVAAEHETTALGAAALAGRHSRRVPVGETVRAGDVTRRSRSDCGQTGGLCSPALNEKFLGSWVTLGPTRARRTSVEEVGGKLEQALFEIRRVIAGQEEMLERVLVCLLAGGHVLIEGVPGLAKTLTIKTTAAVLGGSFQRVQFTPDLVPSDLVGTRVFRPDRTDFETELGPVFCNFLLADEINRAPAKVQSALLEVMQEHQVTIGHNTFPVPSPFLVLATQNPIESEGTYPLPEAQVDRFMLKVLVDYPAHDEELTVVARSLEPAPELAAGALARRAAGAAVAGGRGVRRSGADQLDGRRCDRDARAARPRPGRDRRLRRVRRQPARADQPRRRPDAHSR